MLLRLCPLAVLSYLFTDLVQTHGAVMESSQRLQYAGYQHLRLAKIFVASISLGSFGLVTVAPLTAITSGLLFTRKREEA